MSPSAHAFWSGFAIGVGVGVLLAALCAAAGFLRGGR